MRYVHVCYMQSLQLLIKVDVRVAKLENQHEKSMTCPIVLQPCPAWETHSTITVSYGSVPHLHTVTLWAESTCMTCSLCSLLSEVALHVVECCDL